MTDLTIRQQMATDPSGVLADEFSRHWDRLWRIVDFRLDAALAGRVDPDDILQEAWIAAAHRIEHFIQKETMSIFVWLRLIVGQALIDVERRHLGAKMRDAYRERSIHGDHLNRTTSVSLVARLIGTLTSPSQAAIRQERAAQLRAAIEQMDQLDRSGNIWITDFGLAKHTEGDTLTQTGNLVGTLRYMAPEQFDGTTDHRSDIYSLGLTLYELLTLEPAFDEAQQGRLIQQKTQGTAPRPRSQNPDIPRDLETVVLKACATNPANRYASADELAADLHRFLEDRPVAAR